MLITLDIEQEEQIINTIIIKENDEVLSYYPLDEDVSNRIHILLKCRLISNSQLIGYCNVNSNADIKRTFQIKPQSVKLNNKNNIFNNVNWLPYRLGISVRDAGDDNVHTYRIPGLVTSAQGTLLAVYDVRYESSRDLQGHMDIGLSRSTDLGQNWEKMQIVLDMGEWGGLPQKFNGVSDASITVNPYTNEIIIAGLWMHGVLDDNGCFVEKLSSEDTIWNHQWRSKGSQPGLSPRETSQFLIITSKDDGKSWSKPRSITSEIKNPNWWLLAPAPGNGIVLNDKTIILPTQGRDENGIPFSNITYSLDGGNSWKTSNPAYTNSTECAVVYFDNTIMLNMRDNRNRKEKGDNNGRAIYITTDLGNTWYRHASSNSVLKEPTCMASLISIPANENILNKDLLFFSNPNSMFNRDNMTIKVSTDNGQTWDENQQLLLDEGKGFGYSCLTKVNNEYIGIIYEGSRSQMCFQIIPIRDIVNER